MNDLTPIYAALLGALGAGLVQYLVGRRRVRVQRRAVLRAIVAEVGVLTLLVREQYRPAGLSPLGNRIASNPAVNVFPIDPKLDYFTVYDGLSGRLGSLDEDHAATIVRFYTFYKVAVDVASDDAGKDAIDDALVDLLIELGDRIAQFPDRGG